MKEPRNTDGYLKRTRSTAGASRESIITAVKLEFWRTNITEDSQRSGRTERDDAAVWNRTLMEAGLLDEVNAEEGCIPFMVSVL